jgi:hypothetical protein
MSDKGNSALPPSPAPSPGDWNNAARAMQRRGASGTEEEVEAVLRAHLALPPSPAPQEPRFQSPADDETFEDGA